MSGIAGTTQPGKEGLVSQMLNKISHRGGAISKIREVKNATIGIVCTEAQADTVVRLKEENAVVDHAESGHLALAKAKDDGVILKRDRLGVAPLYFGWDERNELYFASEVKALLDFCKEIEQVPPGHVFDGEHLKPYFELKKKKPLEISPGEIAEELKLRLISSVERRIEMGGIEGSWLSGGLDSSTMAALARPYVSKLHTFAAGFVDAPDVEHAREVANFIKSDHHEVVVSFKDLLDTLPDVIYHLESFDALLVRSSITNYLVAKRSSEYVDAVFSGEGGDELFAGYEYLRNVDQDDLADELIDITTRLHNTALQRVDRSASAHGTVAHVGFLDPDVVDYALRIPVKFKLRNDVEKWILRRAMDGELPKRVLNRKKSKFWEGAGVGELILEYANENISETEFAQERILPNGWMINTKEELMYYRVFREHFGELEDLSWMGRTKGAPKQ
ncbi:MAG: asparagine synthase [Candidatus Aminicenantes bacterium]|nr:MAG: asparagine synthase [Candidatus Aminicenantes bacterium]